RASDGQPDGPVNDPAHRLVAGPPDEDWYPAGVDRRRTYRWGVAVNALTPPRSVSRLQLAIEITTSRVKVSAGSLEVVGSTARREPESQAAIRELIDT